MLAHRDSALYHAAQSVGTQSDRAGDAAFLNLTANRLVMQTMDFSDRTNQIGDACSTMGNSHFTITGRGGLSETLQPLLGSGAGEWHDNRRLTVPVSTPLNLESLNAQTLPQPKPISWLTALVLPTAQRCQ
jgi:hypothetical protein